MIGRETEAGLLTAAAIASMAAQRATRNDPEMPGAARDTGGMPVGFRQPGQIAKVAWADARALLEAMPDDVRQALNEG